MKWMSMYYAFNWWSENLLTNVNHSLQATFKVTLTVPSELTALSNMPVETEKHDGNLKTVYFEESPVMSTYLVAVVIGLFDHIEETYAGK